jgi:hypothetical protein
VECRIEVVDEPDHRLVRLAGRLADLQVPDLVRVCSESAMALQLHLGYLISVDVVGLETLHRLRERGATFIDVPAYIQLKLDAFSARQPRGAMNQTRDTRIL